MILRQNCIRGGYCLTAGSLQSMGEVYMGTPCLQGPVAQNKGYAAAVGVSQETEKACHV